MYYGFFSEAVCIEQVMYAWVTVKHCKWLRFKRFEKSNINAITIKLLSKVMPKYSEASS